MHVRDHLKERGKQLSPRHPDPIAGYREYIADYVGDADLVRFCFAGMLKGVDFMRAEKLQWSDVCPDLNYVTCITYTDETVRIPIEGNVRLLFSRAMASSQSDYVFAGQDQWVANIATIVLLATGCMPVDLRNFDAGLDFPDADDARETRMCFAPWELQLVNLNGSAAPCINFPAFWSPRDDRRFSEVAGAFQQNMLNGTINDVCRRCTLKPAASTRELKQEVEQRRLEDVFATGARVYSDYFRNGSTGTSPSPELRLRVSGTVDETAFDVTGIQAALRLMQYVSHYDRSPDPVLLDWGCGCGRCAKTILKEFPNFRYVGSDIDSEAIGWCRNNLAGGEFHHHGPHPPLPFPDRHFTCVIATSVMTHLGRSEQIAWLHEIYRVLKPGGVFALTLHGMTSALRIDSSIVESLKNEGISDDRLDGALDGVAQDGYYRATFQTEEYTRAIWPDLFEIREYLSGGLALFQDILVLQKPL